MANSIRTPRQGTTATSRRIAQAVDDEEWQEFRLSLKGQPTGEKLHRLKRYYITHSIGGQFASEDVLIRVDNYLKALARGGQIRTNRDYVQALRNDELVIRK